MPPHPADRSTTAGHFPVVRQDAGAPARGAVLRRQISLVKPTVDLTSGAAPGRTRTRAFTPLGAGLAASAKRAAAQNLLVMTAAREPAG